MKPSNEPDYKEIFKKAADIAGAVPEPMQAAAFNRALDLLQGSVPSQVNTPPVSKQPPATHGSDNWQDLIDRTKHPEVSAANTVLLKSLAILRIARDIHGVDGLSPSEISHILRDKFRISVSANQVSDKLGGAGSVVDRHKDGKGYVYRLMHDGDQMLDTPATAKPASRRKKAQKTKEENTTIKKGGSAKKTNGRPGPMVLVTKLITDGFFSSGKKTADVIEYAKKNLGYTYKATDLSPAFIRLVRNGQLKRELDGENQYEYSAS